MTLARFILCGAGATAIHVAVASLGVLLAGLQPLSANCLAYAIATCFSYLANAYFTFKVRPTVSSLRRFLIGSALGLSITAVVADATTAVPWQPWSGIAAVLLTVVPVSYLVMRHYSFGK